MSWKIANKSPILEEDKQIEGLYFVKDYNPPERIILSEVILELKKPLSYMEESKSINLHTDSVE